MPACLLSILGLVVAASLATFTGATSRESRRCGDVSQGWCHRRSERVGSSGVAAAIGNAVHHATGRRIRRQPITPDMLL